MYQWWIAPRDNQLHLPLPVEVGLQNSMQPYFHGGRCNWLSLGAIPWLVTGVPWLPVLLQSFHTRPFHLCECPAQLIVADS